MNTPLVVGPVVDLLSTLTTLALLFGAGALLAAEDGDEDDLLTAVVRTLMCAVAVGVGIGLVLGFLGLWYFSSGLACLAGLVVFLGRSRPRRARVRALAQAVAVSFGQHVRERPALAVLVTHSIGVEALFGLLRPPLSWDALAYHLLLPATWLQQGALTIPFGRHPTSFYGFFPSNGEVWLWWWLAPSHSELYANLAFLPQWLLLALATGLVARQLGAGTRWPLAAAVVATLPVIVRAAATPYIDVHTAAFIVGALALWMRRSPTRRDLAVVGAGLGVAAGSKVFGLVFAGAAAAALGATALLGKKRASVSALAAAVGLMVVLGAPFYLRNIAVGVGPVARECVVATESSSAPMPFAGPQTVLGSLGDRLADHSLVETFLGLRRPNAFELGIGPSALLLALAAAWCCWRGLRDHRWMVLAFLTAVQLGVWITVPIAVAGHLYGHVRYIDAAVACAVAAGVAALAGLGRRLEYLALIVVAQSLLLQSPNLSSGMRLAIGALDLSLVVLALCPPRFRPNGRTAVLGAVGLALLATPAWVDFRLRDRERAFASEWALHAQPAAFAAGAWGHLDRAGGNGPVAVVTEPANRLPVPAMGPRYERPVTYVNIQAPDHRFAPAYPHCVPPRTQPDRQAWLTNLVRAHIRHLLITVDPGREPPIEMTWALESPELFALRYRDATSAVWELIGPLGEAVAAATPNP